MVFFRFPILIPLLPFVFGIVIYGWNINFSLQEILLMLLFFLGLLLILKKAFLRKVPFFESVAMIVFFLFGFANADLHNEKKATNHYLNLDLKALNLIDFEVSERLKPTERKRRYVIELSSINKKSCVGKVLLTIPIDSLTSPLSVGSRFSTYATLEELPPPQSTWQFDYKKYLERKHIYSQIDMNSARLIYSGSSTSFLKTMSNSFKQRVNDSLIANNFNPKARSIINALLLGQRQDVAPELYKSYTQAGAVHILAVSGLHVGIIWLLLEFVFMPLLLIRYGGYVRLFLVLLFLWGFAFVAGFSPSVVRAVTMFSAIALAKIMRRQSNTTQILLLSMLVLLVAKPNFLYEVGFQLSYIAVFAIVWIAPKFERVWRPKSFILKKVWQILSVSLAAQIGVFPLGLYYFNQFPGLFFVSSLVILPFLGVLLGLGIAVLFLAILGLLPSFLSIFYEALINWLNDFVSWVAGQKTFLFTEVSISFKSLIAIYLIVIAFVILLYKLSFKRITGFVLSILGFALVLFVEKFQAENTREFYVFNTYKGSVYAERNGKQLSIYTTEDDSVINAHYQLSTYLSKFPIKDKKILSLKNVYSYKGKTLLVIDSLGVYQIKGLKHPIVLLTQSAKINLDRLIDSLQPKILIADGSNYPSLVNRWKTTCEKKGVSFFSTQKQGVFSLK